MEKTLLDKAKIDLFWQSRAKEDDPRLATHFKHDTALEYDVALIKKLLPPNARVLDLGCGTGAIANEIAHNCSYIRAIDKVDAFLKHCNKIIDCSVADVATYVDDNNYDIIIIFGVMNYLEEFEAKHLFANCHKMLKRGGKLIVKNACGVNEDVIIDKFSPEIGAWYHATYRHYKKESQMIQQQFRKIEIIDIYPKELNKWSNTHFYAFVATKE